MPQFLPRKSFDFGCDAVFDLGELLVAPRVPQLIEYYEGHDQDLEEQPKDSKGHVLNGDHLRCLVLEEGGEHSSWVGGTSADT